MTVLFFSFSKLLNLLGNNLVGRVQICERMEEISGGRGSNNERRAWVESWWERLPFWKMDASRYWWDASRGLVSIVLLAIWLRVVKSIVSQEKALLKIKLHQFVILSNYRWTLVPCWPFCFSGIRIHLMYSIMYPYLAICLCSDKCRDFFSWFVYIFNWVPCTSHLTSLN